MDLGLLPDASVHASSSEFDAKCDDNTCRASQRTTSTTASTAPLGAFGDDSHSSHRNDNNSPRSLKACSEVPVDLIDVGIRDGSLEECCVCLDAGADADCSLPCGHLCLCAPCAQKLAATPGRNRCPYCRAAFQIGDEGYVAAPDVNPLYDGSLYRALRTTFLEQQTQWHNEEPVRCPCGEVMVKVQAHSAYFVTTGCPVECDICRRIVRGRSIVYHCPHELGSHHPFGFDLCRTCAQGEEESHPMSCLFATWNVIRQWLVHFRMPRISI